LDFKAQVDGSKPWDRGVGEEEDAGDEARLVDALPGDGLVEHLAGVVVDGGKDQPDKDRVADQEGGVPPTWVQDLCRLAGARALDRAPVDVAVGMAAAPAGDDAANTSVASNTASIDSRRMTMSMTSPSGRAPVGLCQVDARPAIPEAWSRMGRMRTGRAG
jgi:hypothetical protein